MSLSVITHTTFRNLEWLERCKRSVAAGLPPGAVHKIIDCRGKNWAHRRLYDTLDDEFIAFVDDDDYIAPGALALCLKAIKETGLGTAFTNEVTVKPDETVIRYHNERKRYESIRVLPRAIHHLSVIRTSAIDIRSLDLHQKFEMGIDWFVRASAALVHGAVHVPINGYYWTIHENSTTSLYHNRYIQNMPAMTQLIEGLWGRRCGYLPRYEEAGVNSPS